MAKNWLEDLKALLIDMDGVVYRGEMPLPGAVEAVGILQRHGIAHAFVTNNATLTPEQFQAKLARMGVPAQAEDIVTSAVATAAYLRSIAPPGTGVCAVGEHGLRQALLDAGFEVDHADPHFVVVALHRQLTYQDLVAACRAIQRGAPLIATNVDPALPVEDGLWPGAGAIVAAISTATGAKPTVIGKPQPTLLQVALDRLGVNAADAAIVGDQVRSDVQAGKAAGTATILVTGDLALLSSPLPSGGEGKPKRGDITPDLTVSSLADLLERIEREHLPIGDTQ